MPGRLEAQPVLRLQTKHLQPRHGIARQPAASQPLPRPGSLVGNRLDQLEIGDLEELLQRIALRRNLAKPLLHAPIARLSRQVTPPQPAPPGSARNLPIDEVPGVARPVRVSSRILSRVGRKPMMRETLLKPGAGWEVIGRRPGPGRKLRGNSRQSGHGSGLLDTILPAPRHPAPPRLPCLDTARGKCNARRTWGPGKEPKKRRRRRLPGPCHPVAKLRYRAGSTATPATSRKPLARPATGSGTGTPGQAGPGPVERRNVVPDLLGRSGNTSRCANSDSHVAGLFVWLARYGRHRPHGSILCWRCVNLSGNCSSNHW